MKYINNIYKFSTSNFNGCKEPNEVENEFNSDFHDVSQIDPNNIHLEENHVPNQDICNRNTTPKVEKLLYDKDIQKIDQICKKAEEYFSKTQPGYYGIEVYVDNKMQKFAELERNKQIEVLKTAHGSRLNLESLRVLSPDEFNKNMSDKICSKKGSFSKIHGLEHAVGTALTAQKLCTEYLNNFSAFQNMNNRVCLCSIVAALLHDIGRTSGGDGFDIFGPTSAHLAEKILKEVQCFSSKEIEWITNAIKKGGFCKHEMDYRSKEDIKNGTSVLSKELLVACIMGDADRLQFERFDKNKCNINYLSIKEIGLSTKGGKSPDEILNSLKNEEGKIVNLVNKTRLEYRSTGKYSLYRMVSGKYFGNKGSNIQGQQNNNNTKNYNHQSNAVQPKPRGILEWMNR